MKEGAFKPPSKETLASDEHSSLMPVEAAVPRTTTFKADVVKVNPWVHFLAGGVAGMMGALLTSPLDVVKTRLQSDFNSSLSSKAAKTSNNLIMRGYGHVLDTFGIIKTLYRQEGMSAMFKGLGPNLAGVVPARAVNFFTYDLGKQFLLNHFGESNDPGHTNAWIHLVAGVNAGIVTSTVTNPIWLVKTRLQLDRSQRQNRLYKNSLDCAKTIVRKEGFTALYQGMSASYLGTIESSLQWVLYEQMKAAIARRQQRRVTSGATLTKTDHYLDWFARSGAAGAAKLVASILTYPHEVVRTRLRQAPLKNGQPKYKGLVHCFKTVIREEGLASMYGGLTPHLLRTVPNSIIMFGTWDLIVRLAAKD